MYFTFSNGSEFENWESHFCLQCKSGDLEEQMDFEDIKCPIQRKILMQMFISDKEQPEIYQFTDEEIKDRKCIQFKDKNIEEPKVVIQIKEQMRLEER